MAATPPPSAKRAAQVVPVFPTPILVAPDVVGGEVRDAIIAAARDSRTAANAKSQQLSHTTPVDADEDPLYRPVAAAIRPHLAEFGALLFGERRQWRVKEIWVNLLQNGGAQALHNHANSFISGVVYLTESHAASGTVFHKALGGSEYSFVNQNARTKMGPFSASRWQIPPVSPGDMVLFPSYLLHEVPPNEGAERITIAFNALPDQFESWGYTVKFT